MGIVRIAPLESVCRIEPLRPAPARSDDIFVNSEKEFVEQLQEQLSVRPEVWGVGLWPDEESEQIAKGCAECFLKIWDLPVKLIPADPLDGLAMYGDEDFDLALECIEQKHHCEIDWRELERKNAVTLAGLVAMIKERQGTKPPKPDPWGWLGELLDVVLANPGFGGARRLGNVGEVVRIMTGECTNG